MLANRLAADVASTFSFVLNSQLTYMCMFHLISNILLVVIITEHNWIDQYQPWWMNMDVAYVDGNFHGNSGCVNANNKVTQTIASNIQKRIRGLISASKKEKFVKRVSASRLRNSIEMIDFFWHSFGNTFKLLKDEIELETERFFFSAYSSLVVCDMYNCTH